MKKYLKLILFAATAILTFTQCDEDTAGIGSSIVPESDIVTIATDTFTAKSKSIDVANSILNNSETLYLGRYTEPENNTTFEASFATQFNSGYGAAFPEDGVKMNRISLAISYATPRRTPHKKEHSASEAISLCERSIKSQLLL